MGYQLQTVLGVANAQAHITEAFIENLRGAVGGPDNRENRDRLSRSMGEGTRMCNELLKSIETIRHEVQFFLPLLTPTNHYHRSILI